MEWWNVGILGKESLPMGNIKLSVRKNINRGYQKLVIWQDSIEYYRQVCLIVPQLRTHSYRIADNMVSCVDSIHRNIAEGYCRRSINEYLNFLNIALGSLGESVSSLSAYETAGQLSEECFEILDCLAYKIENGLIKLIAKLQEKKQTRTWQDTMSVREPYDMNVSEDYGN